MGAHWAAMLRVAITRFGLTPAAFWALSLNEWRALVEDGAESPLPRSALDALIARYAPEDVHDR